MRKRQTVFLTPAEAERLDALALAINTSPEQRQSLRAVLDRAVVDAADASPPAVVRLHTPFLCIEAQHREHFHWRIVYPEEADFRRGRLSVLSPAGMALLGMPTGRHVRVPVDGGAQPLEVVVQELLPA